MPLLNHPNKVHQNQQFYQAAYKAHQRVWRIVSGPGSFPCFASGSIGNGGGKDIGLEGWTSWCRRENRGRVLLEWKGTRAEPLPDGKRWRGREYAHDGMVWGERGKEKITKQDGMILTDGISQHAEPPQLLHADALHHPPVGDHGRHHVRHGPQDLRPQHLVQQLNLNRSLETYERSIEDAGFVYVDNGRRGIEEGFSGCPLDYLSRQAKTDSFV